MRNLGERLCVQEYQALDHAATVAPQRWSGAMKRPFALATVSRVALLGASANFPCHGSDGEFKVYAVTTVQIPPSD